MWPHRLWYSLLRLWLTKSKMILPSQWKLIFLILKKFTRWCKKVWPGSLDTISMSFSSSLENFWSIDSEYFSTSTVACLFNKSTCYTKARKSTRKMITRSPRSSPQTTCIIFLKKRSTITSMIFMTCLSQLDPTLFTDISSLKSIRHPSSGIPK